jgi:O-antigen/teichoic acid export membrane protein
MLKHSIIRSSLIATPAFVLGHAFNYGLMITANRLLTTNTFGRLYTAISLLNVLYTPAIVLAFLFGRHFAIVYSGGGRDAVAQELRELFHRQLIVGAAAVAVVAVMLLFFASAVGADAFVLLLLVPATAFAVYLLEMLRSSLQGMLAFVAYSVAWIAWCAGQYSFAVIGLLLTGTAWAGMAGIFLATAAVMLVMFLWITRRARRDPRGEARSWPPFRILGALPFAVEYGVFVLVNNIDVLIAYLVLSNDNLGVYAASAVLPKAIVTATQPVSQVMLPVMAASSEGQQFGKVALIKALGFCAVVAAAGAGVLYLGSGLACNSSLGLRFCAPTLLTILALAAIPLGMLRVLVVACLAVGRKDHIVVPILGVIAVAVALLLSDASPERLAEAYLACCWVFLGFYAVTMLFGLRSAGATRSSFGR